MLFYLSLLEFNFINFEVVYKSINLKSNWFANYEEAIVVI